MKNNEKIKSKITTSIQRMMKSEIKKFKNIEDEYWDYDSDYRVYLKKMSQGRINVMFKVQKRIIKILESEVV